MSTQLDLDDVAATSELARKQLNALRAENKRLRDAALAFQELTVCYRINKRPSEKLFKRLEKARAALGKE
jgi:hypothetical protein